MFQKEKLAQFAMLIYESPEAFASRKGEGSDSYTGAWRAYHKAVVEAGVFVGGDPLELLETGTIITKEGKRGVQDGPYLLCGKTSHLGCDFRDQVRELTIS